MENALTGDRQTDGGFKKGNRNSSAYMTPTSDEGQKVKNLAFHDNNRGMINVVEREREKWEKG